MNSRSQLHPNAEEAEDAIELDPLDSDGVRQDEDLDLEPKEEMFFNAEHIELAGNEFYL